MWLTGPRRAAPAPDEHRRVARFVAAVISGVVTVVYAVLLVVVYRQEMAAHVETTYGAYLFLAIAYALGAAALALRDSAWVLVVGAVVQITVLVLYVLFGTAADVSIWWGVVTSGLELVLLGLLVLLIWTLPRRPAKTLDDFSRGW